MRTETPLSPWEPSAPGPPGRGWDRGATGLRRTCLPLGHQGSRQPTKIYRVVGRRWAVSRAARGLNTPPGLGRPTPASIPALPSPSCVALGRSLYLSVPVSSSIRCLHHCSRLPGSVVIAWDVSNVVPIMLKMTNKNNNNYMGLPWRSNG